MFLYRISPFCKKYFLSSLGDEAAFELACLKLDRYEFLPSIRLIDKILNDYPDTNIKRSDLLVRAAVLSARVGDIERAKQLLETRSRALVEYMANHQLVLNESKTQVIWPKPHPQVPMSVGQMVVFPSRRLNF